MAGDDDFARADDFAGDADFAGADDFVGDDFAAFLLASVVFAGSAFAGDAERNLVRDDAVVSVAFVFLGLAVLGLVFVGLVFLGLAFLGLVFLELAFSGLVFVGLVFFAIVFLVVLSGLAAALRFGAVGAMVNWCRMYGSKVDLLERELNRRCGRNLVIMDQEKTRCLSINVNKEVGCWNANDHTPNISIPCSKVNFTLKIATAPQI